MRFIDVIIPYEVTSKTIAEATDIRAGFTKDLLEEFAIFNEMRPLQIKSISGSFTIEAESVVKHSAGIATLRSLSRERTDARMGNNCDPNILGQNLSFSNKCFHVPWPTVPKPNMPTFNTFGMSCV